MQVSGDGAGPEGRWVRWTEMDNVRILSKRFRNRMDRRICDGFGAGECEDRKQEVGMVQVFDVNNQAGGGSTAELED